MFSSLSFKYAPLHNRNSTEDEVTVLHIAAAWAALVGIQMYAQRQESALGGSHGEQGILFPWEAEATSEGQLQEEMSRVPEPCRWANWDPVMKVRGAQWILDCPPWLSVET